MSFRWVIGRCAASGGGARPRGGLRGGCASASGCRSLLCPLGGPFARVPLCVACASDLPARAASLPFCRPYATAQPPLRPVAMRPRSRPLPPLRSLIFVALFLSSTRGWVPRVRPCLCPCGPHARPIPALPCRVLAFFSAVIPRLPARLGTAGSSLLVPLWAPCASDSRAPSPCACSCRLVDPCVHPKVRDASRPYARTRRASGSGGKPRLPNDYE